MHANFVIHISDMLPETAAKEKNTHLGYWHQKISAKENKSLATKSNGRLGQ